jgi:hypothetical protein
MNAIRLSTTTIFYHDTNVLARYTICFAGVSPAQTDHPPHDVPRTRRRHLQHHDQDVFELKKRVVQLVYHWELSEYKLELRVLPIMLGCRFCNQIFVCSELMVNARDISLYTTT